MVSTAKVIFAKRPEVLRTRRPCEGYSRKGSLYKKTRGRDYEAVLTAKVVFAKRPEGDPEDKEVLWRGGLRSVNLKGGLEG